MCRFRSSGFSSAQDRFGLESKFGPVYRTSPERFERYSRGKHARDKQKNSVVLSRNCSIRSDRCGLSPVEQLELLEFDGVVLGVRNDVGGSLGAVVEGGLTDLDPDRR